MKRNTVLATLLLLLTAGVVSAQMNQTLPQGTEIKVRTDSGGWRSTRTILSSG
jgi:hypothetical protein